MIINYSEISRITFPVYQLPSGNWYLADGLLFLDGEIVDDKNMPGDTIGKRRLQTYHKNLLPLKNMYQSHVGIIKQANPHFIDNTGRPFIYQKTRMCPLKYHKIKKVDKREVASVLYLHGVKRSFIIPRPPPDDVRWAGILYLHGFPWMLYSYSKLPATKSSRRKV